MRSIVAALLALALIAIAQSGPVIAQSCPQGYVDCGRGLCCPQ
jgi:hypothetical protein